MGVEPIHSAWKADALPLRNNRMQDGFYVEALSLRLISTTRITGSLRSFVPDKGWTCRGFTGDPVFAVHAPGYRLASSCSAPAE